MLPVVLTRAIDPVPAPPCKANGPMTLVELPETITAVAVAPAPPVKLTPVVAVMLMGPLAEMRALVIAPLPPVRATWSALIRTVCWAVISENVAEPPDTNTCEEPLAGRSMVTLPDEVIRLGELV